MAKASVGAPSRALGGAYAEPQAPAPVAPPSTESGKLAMNDPPGGGTAVMGTTRDSRAPILIYTATLTLAVFDVAPGLAAVEKLAEEVGGFLSKRTDRSVTIRVPSARFQDVVTRVTKLGDVTHRDVTAEDVTEEFADLEIRIRNARATRDRLEQLLAKAVNVTDSVAIERELTRVTGELERLEGRIKFLKDRAAYSTITVAFEARHTEQVESLTRLPFPWLNQLGLGHLLNL
jgi:hypothetical protein